MVLSDVRHSSRSDHGTSSRWFHTVYICDISHHARYDAASDTSAMPATIEYGDGMLGKLRPHACRVPIYAVIAPDTKQPTMAIVSSALMSCRNHWSYGEHR